MDALALMTYMRKAGFPTGEYLITKRNGERGINVWLSEAGQQTLADICLIAEWMDDKPVTPTR